MKNNIIIFSHDRPRYLDLLLNQLSNIFYDDKWNDFFESIDIFYSGNLSLPYSKVESIKNVKINYVLTGNTTSSSKINESFFKYFQQDVLEQGYLLYLDDDCFLDKDRFIHFFGKIKESILKETIYSIYNSMSHRISKYNANLKLFEKETSGMLGLLVPKSIINQYIRLTNLRKFKPKICADSIFIHFYRNHFSKNVLVNRISIIQHIGFEGENNNYSKKDKEYSSSFIYKNNLDNLFLESIFDHLTKQISKKNFNFFLKVFSSLRYKLIRRRVLIKRKNFNRLF